MEITATLELKYCESPSQRFEWLELHVQFKQGNQFLKTRLQRTLASSENVQGKFGDNRYDTLDTYYKDVEQYTSNITLLTEEAKKMILAHINEKKKKVLKDIKDIGRIDFKFDTTN